MRLLPILLLAATLAPPAPAQDLPVLPAEDHADWQAVGRVNSAGYRKREMCSGVLIAPDHVLTAAHCVSGLDGTGPLPSEFTFVAGWMRGTATDSVPVASIWVHPKAYAPGGLDIRHDIAVLTLERPSTVAPLPLAAEPEPAPFGIVGYTTRRPHMLSARFDCGGSAPAALLQLNCAVMPGNSGGPVVVRTGDGWSVAAIVSAMGRDGALAVPVSRLEGRYPPTM